MKSRHENGLLTASILGGFWHFCHFSLDGLVIKGGCRSFDTDVALPIYPLPWPFIESWLAESLGNNERLKSGCVRGADSFKAS